jgi:hypothetical protein
MILLLLRAIAARLRASARRRTILCVGRGDGFDDDRRLVRVRLLARPHPSIRQERS